MKRFRFTFLAICLMLLWLGSSDVGMQLRNQAPLVIDLNNLPPGQPPQEWLSISGGHLDLLQGINMSGTIEVGSFLIPLITDRDKVDARVWVETRDPELVSLLTTYYFKLDDDRQRSAYLKEHADEFFVYKTVTGMTADNQIAANNQSKLLELLKSMNINPAGNILFLSEGKEPNRVRGPIFLALAALGFLKFYFWGRSRAKTR